MREVTGTAMGEDGHAGRSPGPTPLIKLGAWPLKFLPRPPLTPDAVDFINQPATVDIGPLLAAMPRPDPSRRRAGHLSRHAGAAPWALAFEDPRFGGA